MNKCLRLLWVTFLIGCSSQAEEDPSQSKKNWLQIFKNALQRYNENFWHGTPCEEVMSTAGIVEYKQGDWIPEIFLNVLRLSCVENDYCEVYYPDNKTCEKKLWKIKKDFPLIIMKETTRISTEAFNKERKIALLAAGVLLAYWQRQRIYNAANYVAEKAMSACKQLGLVAG